MRMDDEPEPKRHKISRGNDDYVPGNITKIELCNFMTFDKLTCKPGSRLNLVIGPIGSGKSSLVCAIALGLGGEPQLLGRATSVGAYVKRGEESGYIKISLRGERKDDPIVITRKIDIRNKSEWLFNVMKKEINEIILRFNVQVNNLTQFLPQDRVCEFAKLTPVQILEETEKAVGDPQLPIQHQTLITKSQELKNLERAIESNKGSLDHLKAQNAELERDFERVRQRDALLAKVESMKKKLPWIKYDIKKAEYMEAKEHEKEAKLRLDEANNAKSELEKPIKEKNEEKSKKEAKCKEITCLLESNMKKCQELLKSDDELGVQIRGKYNEIKELRHDEESQQQSISKAKEELAAAEAELASLLPCEHPKHKTDELKSQILELDEIAKDIKSKKMEREKELANHRSNLNKCIAKLKQMESVGGKRMQVLLNSGAKNIVQARDWVRANRDKFNKEVYGPVLRVVNVSDKFHANYLEGHVSSYIWKAFITQDAMDRNLLVKHVGTHFPVVNHEERDRWPREPFQITDEMRKLGISSRLDQVFEAPYAVKEILISKKATKNYGQRLSAAKRHAESIAMLTPKLQRAFSEMPSTVEDLEAAIQDIRSQADSVLCLNPNVLQEYENRRRKIEELMEQQEMDENEFNGRSNEINALKELWLPTLRNLVNQINETFSRNFREMAVAGEVSLDEHGMDFAQYGILIKVKFRQTGQLQVLSAHHQSGGERSVSTILYLISLQDLTNCPFRVVDEINQGMDPVNERKMFQQLVRAASQQNTPQCFLLTPKLLPNLEYSDACSILTVMNGPWIEQPSQVWSGGDSWGSLRVPIEENCN